MSMTGSCAEQTVKTCPIGISRCESATVVTQIGKSNMIEFEM